MDHPLAVNFIRWIVVLPLAGAAINFLLGARLQRRLGKRAISIVGCSVVLAPFVLALGAFVHMTGLPPEHRFMLDRLWRWIEIGRMRLEIAFWLDPLSMIMTLVVTGVGA